VWPPPQFLAMTNNQLSLCLAYSCGSIDVGIWSKPALFFPFERSSPPTFSATRLSQMESKWPSLKLRTIRCVVISMCNSEIASFACLWEVESSPKKVSFPQFDVSVQNCHFCDSLTYSICRTEYPKVGTQILPWTIHRRIPFAC
jgi:hypothetical protein